MQHPTKADFQKAMEVAKRAHRENLSVDEQADLLGITDPERRLKFKMAQEAAKAPWQEIKKGLSCECGRKLKFTGRRTTKVVNGLGYDIFHFICDCGILKDRKWRAPALDGQVLKPYTVRYTMGQPSTTRIEDYDGRR